MPKRIKIEFVKSPLDYPTRKAFIELYKVAKQGEKAYFQERLFDYPYYLRFWDGEQLVGFRGIEICKLNAQKAEQTMIELGESFMLPAYVNKALMTRISMKVLWSFWKEHLINLGSKSLLSPSKFLLLSNEIRNSKIHFYHECLPGLASNRLEKISQFDTWTAIKLYCYNCKENCKRLFRFAPTKAFPSSMVA